MAVGMSMACFAACTNETPVVLEEPIIVEETEVLEAVPETVSEPEALEEEIVLEEQITLEEFQAMVDAMMKEETHKTETVSESFYDRAKAEEAFGKANEVRASYGVSPLVWEEALYELACERAKEITAQFSHERPDGSYVGAVIIGQMGAGGCGENIASNYESVSNLINGWMASEGHRENLLNDSFRGGAMGCYRHNGSCYWVHLFRQ